MDDIRGTVEKFFKWGTPVFRRTFVFVMLLLSLLYVIGLFTSIGININSNVSDIIPIQLKIIFAIFLGLATLWTWQSWA